MQRIILLIMTMILFMPFLWSDIELSIEVPFPDISSDRTSRSLPVMQRPGEPMLPYLPLRILLPQGNRVTGLEVEVEESGRALTGIEIQFFGKQVPISERASHTSSSVQQTGFDMKQSYPAETYREFGQQRKMGYDILIVNLYPYKYFPENGTLSIADSYRLKIRTEYETELAEEQNRFLLTNEDARNEIKRLVNNPELVYSYTKSLYSTDSILPDPSEPYSMIVITDAVRAGYFDAYLDWKRSSGISVDLFLLEDIYQSYSGVDNQEKIRNFIIDAYETYSLSDTPLEYVLLGGDDVVVPYRGMYCFVSGLWNDYVDYNIPSDVYYSNLDGNWDANGNGIYGELDDGIDWFAEVAIGRIPAYSKQDFLNFFHKNIHYATTPSYSNDIAIMIGQNLDSITWGGDYKDEIIPIIPDQFHIETYYEKDGTYSSVAIREAVNRGLGILNHLGHSNQNTVFGMTGSNVNQLTNQDFGIAYSQGCYTAAFDNATTPESDAIGQRFVNASNGFFAFIGNTRYGWYWPGSTEGASQLYDVTFFKGLFEQDIRRIGKTLNYSKESLVNEAIDNNFQHHLWKNGFMLWTFYNQILFGDPSAHLHTATGLYPFLEPSGIVFDDVTGDNDGVINPGETVNIYIELRNLPNWSDASSVKAVFSGDHPEIEIISEEISFPVIPEGSTEISAEPFIISLSPNIAYGDYTFTVSISAKGNEGHEFTKDYLLSIPISLKQQYWPWEANYPIQGAPIVYEDDLQATIIIAVDALSNLNFLNERAEILPHSYSIGENMLKSAAMGDLRNDGNLAIVLNNRAGSITAFDMQGNRLFEYKTAGQFILSPILADVTGNSELEIISYSIDRKLHVLNADGEPLDGFPLSYEQNVMVELAAADLNEDGRAEIILGTVTGLIDAIDLSGVSLPGFPVDLGSGINVSPIVLDNRHIVTGTQNNLLTLISSCGTIVWEKPVSNRIISEAIAADFTDNEMLEIAFVTSNGKVYIVLQDGEPLEGFPVSLGYNIGQPPLAADLDNSGLPNLVFATSNGLVYGLNRDGSIIDMLPAPLLHNASSPLFIADIDRDGDYEIGYGTNLGISMIDYKLQGGESVPWSEYRGNSMRTGFYNDNTLVARSYAPPVSLRTELRQNFPNPFNISTTVPFYLETSSRVRLAVYNIKGQLVKELFTGTLEKGHSKVIWNGRDYGNRTVASGIYFVKMKTPETTQVRKMLLLK